MDAPRPFFPLIPSEEMKSPSTAAETLGAYVRKHRGDRSLSEIEENSARKGKRVAASYINRIERGEILRPSNERLTAIAHGLGRPPAEIHAVASGKPMTKSDARLARLEKALQSLPEDRQDDVVDFATMLEKKYAKVRAA